MFLNPDERIHASKRKLPHWQQGGVMAFVTWRLNDSIPGSVLQKSKQEREAFHSEHPKPWNDETKKEYAQRFTWPLENYLDAGHGSCVLKEAHLRQIINNALHHFDKERYKLDSYVVMPNHVHILFTPKQKLSDILHTWKRFTAREINKTLNQDGALWQAESWDRLIRSEKHLLWTRKYIADNPKHLPEGTYTLWRSGF